MVLAVLLMSTSRNVNFVSIMYKMNLKNPVLNALKFNQVFQELDYQQVRLFSKFYFLNF